MAASQADPTPKEDPREIVWAVCNGIKHAGQMTRATLATSDGWSEVKESHQKVQAALGQPHTTETREQP